MAQLMRWQPMRDLDAMVGGLEGWLGSGPLRPTRDGASRRFTPACEVFERDGETMLRFDIPGIDPEHDLEVTVEGDTLRVGGERRAQSEEGEGPVRYGELAFGRFERCLALPEGTEHDRIRAHYDRGVLEVAIPNGAIAEARKIPVTHIASDSETPITTAAA